MAQSSGWCFTINNAVKSLEWREASEGFLDMPRQALYLVYQVEEAPSTGAVHVQGYVYLTSKRTLAFVKDLFPDSPHWERARGTPAQNIAYCTKEPRLAGPWEQGDRPAPGKSKPLAAAVELIKEGKGLRAVAEEYPAMIVLHSRGLQALQIHCLPPVIPWRTIEVTWYWGRTGVGKTRRCYEEHPGLYCVRGDGQWWDGYLDQECILFDEFYGQVKCSDMLRWLDGYPCALPVKGGFTEARWTKVYITSNVDPNGSHEVEGGAYKFNIYPSVPEEVREAFFRRISNITPL